jgi:DNA-binding response OmpR family regulator
MPGGEALELKTVLVADDNEAFCALVGRVLREHHLEVIQAADGRAARDLIFARRPQLVILDALMPLLSGFDLLLQLREKLPEYTPIIFVVTGVYKAHRWESETRLQYQIHEYLVKPIWPKDLLAAVARHFPDFATVPI